MSVLWLEQIQEHGPHATSIHSSIYLQPLNSVRGRGANAASKRKINYGKFTYTVLNTRPMSVVASLQGCEALTVKV